jgi:hypothetical protein
MKPAGKTRGRNNIGHSELGHARNVVNWPSDASLAGHVNASASSGGSEICPEKRASLG